MEAEVSRLGHGKSYLLAVSRSAHTLVSSSLALLQRVQRGGHTRASDESHRTAYLHIALSLDVTCIYLIRFCKSIYQNHLLPDFVMLLTRACSLVAVQNYGKCSLYDFDGR